MQWVSLEEASKQLYELAKAAIAGEEVFIVTEDCIQQLMRVTPQPKFGSAKGLIEMSDDFDAPLDDFKDYME